jgi:hypothetical protein
MQVGGMIGFGEEAIFAVVAALNHVLWKPSGHYALHARHWRSPVSYFEDFTDYLADRAGSARFE